MILLTVILTVINVTWTVFYYIWYKDCVYNVIMISITLLVCITFFAHAINLIRTIGDASILSSSIVFTYILYL